MSAANYENDIQFWRSEEILKLANHFHHFDGDQHKRVNHFEMSINDVKRFSEIGTIDTVNICLALKSPAKSSDFTFYPILRITRGGLDEVLYFPLEPKASLEKDEFLTELVPGIFKEMIQDNWNKIDITYIDDLFIAQAWDEANSVALNHMVRVHEFIIDKDMMPFINGLNTIDGIVPNITNIKLYPGVDMNKFGNKEFISFTPVLGFTHNKDVSAYGRIGIIEAVKNETYLEYNLPCPPCRKKKF